MRWLLPLLAALAPVAATAQSTATGAAFPPAGKELTVNLLQWGPNRLPRVYERSSQLPLTDDEVDKLLAAGLEPAQVAKIIEERRCACDASAEGLVRLKKAGADRKVIEAVSLHALAPNRAIELVLTIDLVGEGTEARDAFLYLFIDDGPVTRTYTVNLEDALAGRYQQESFVDRSDLVLARRVRRVQISGEIPLKTYGHHQLLLATSAQPSLAHPDELGPAERERAQLYSIEYPRASLSRQCRIGVTFKRDAALAHRWLPAGSRIDCEWN